MGKIAATVIAKLRNDVFTSLAALNAGIRKAVKEFNDKPLQKRSGSRRSIFETEEKPYLRTLPLIPYEVCEWSYGHKVGNNSHIWWNKGQYSVPYKYIGCRVGVKFNSHLVFIYYISMSCLNSAVAITQQSLSDSILLMNGIAGPAEGRRRIPSWTELSIMPMKSLQMKQT